MNDCSRTSLNGNGRRLLAIIVIAALLAVAPGDVTRAVRGQEVGLQQPAQEQRAQDEPSESQQLTADQDRIAERYELLESKLFSLHEFESDSNPIRSRLLKRAFLQSQERMTAARMRTIVDLLSQSKLKQAESDQQAVLQELQQLLELLQSEDRGKRVRDEIRRHQEYLKEVERILRIQKGIRGQTEGGVDNRRLAKSQNKAADRTKKLADEIRENEESGIADAGDGNDQEPPRSNSDPSGEPSETEDGENQEENKSGDGKSDKNENADRADGSSSDSESDGRKSSGAKPKPPGQPQSQESQPQGSESDDSGEQGAPAQSQGQGDQSEPGKGSQQGSPQQPPAQDHSNPVRRRIQAAEKRMRDAEQKLEQARRGDSVKDMEQAERELARAKQELEEILRQLREEEIERTLAMLEGRFRQMLEREIRVYESTRKLDRTPPQQRGTDFEINCGKLAVEQNAIATDASRALMLLREDGSSIAFPETVEQMHEDMLQVAARLNAAKVGQITIEIEEDIIDTLDYLIEALVKTQQDLEAAKSRQQPGQPAQQPGDQPLVDQLAEIKMLRGLQERIYRRHTRYSRLLEDPDHPIGTTNDPDLRQALDRLSLKQQQLVDIARDIVLGKNR